MTFARLNIKMLLPLVVLLFAVPSVFARPEGYEVREAVRSTQQVQKTGRESDRSGRFNDQAPNERSSGSESSKRSGRMSPEERRALRQQINEASQDLYYRKR